MQSPEPAKSSPAPEDTSLEDIADESRRRFAAHHGSEPSWIVAAPGRINLIGEHVDYNDGFVLPMAIERWTVIAAAPNGTATAGFTSSQVDEPAEIRLDSMVTREGPAWSHYVRGVIAGFQRRGIDIEGFDAEIHSTVPKGGGLSSSAALEVATATLLEMVSGEILDPVEKALLCQTAEHDFAGVPCGIMDQFASTLCRKDNLLLLDCRSRETEHVPFADQKVSILIANTNVSHELSDGGYAARKAQCEAAAESLLLPSLRDATLDQLERAKRRMEDKVYRRARHVVSEIARTMRAVDALKSEDWETCGRLMMESHVSLRDDYEVSCAELDTFVEIAQTIGQEGGVYGCRMTGAGFGGCTVSLVRSSDAAHIAAEYEDSYRSATGIEPAIFFTRASQGAQVLLPKQGVAS